ncbi:MAG: hypothetical protein QXQ18_02580 [Candidatus Aenigmatarchaeota archaeon]
MRYNDIKKWYRIKKRFEKLEKIKFAEERLNESIKEEIKSLKENIYNSKKIPLIEKRLEEIKNKYNILHNISVLLEILKPYVHSVYYSTDSNHVRVFKDRKETEEYLNLLRLNLLRPRLTNNQEIKKFYDQLIRITSEYINRIKSGEQEKIVICYKENGIEFKFVTSPDIISQHHLNNLKNFVESLYRV